MFFRKRDRPAETIPQLPPVDFEAIAEHAIEEGVFALDAITRVHPHTSMPATMLDIPYNNGPAAIEIHDEDVPVPAMNAVRENFKTANKLLLPSEQVNLYFHHRFIRDDALNSKTLADAVKSFRTTDTDMRINKTATSFQVQGKERKVHDRHLYTQEELIASLDFTIEHPEAALSILTYRSLIADYLSELGTVFAGRAHRIPANDRKNFDVFIRQWSSKNFENTLLPALTILHRDAQMRAPQATGKDLIDQALFQQALTFVTDSGGFRNWVTVPADVAQDGVERVSTFLCPAVSAIRGQLGDGDVLAKMFTIISQKANNSDPQVIGMLNTIRTAAKSQKREPSKEERAANYLRRIEPNKPMEIVLDGQPTTLHVDGEDFIRMTGHYNEGDRILTFDTYNPADDLYGAFKKAILAVSLIGTPVHFQFNEQDYRVTPDDLQSLAAATRQIKQSD